MADGEILDLHSNFLEKMGAKVGLPAVWGPGTPCNGRFYGVGRGDGVVFMKMHENFKNPNIRKCDTVFYGNRWKETFLGQVYITVFPAHLASARVYLLPGKDGDDFIRVLFLPDTASGGPGPPEVKFLRVTLNQILEKLEESKRVKDYKADGDSVGDMGGAEKDANEDSWETASDSGSDF